MNNQFSLQIFFLALSSCLLAITPIFAGPIEKTTAEERRRVLNNLRINILTTQAQANVTFNELRTQRDNLQKKILSASQEYKKNMAALKTSSKKAIDDLHASLQKMKTTSKSVEEIRDYETINSQSVSDEVALNQAYSTLESVTLPKDIID